MKISSVLKMNFLFFFAQQQAYLCSSSSFESSTLACTVSPRIAGIGRSGTAFSQIDGPLVSLLGFGRSVHKASARLQSVQSCSSHFRMRIPCDSAAGSSSMVPILLTSVLYFGYYFVFLIKIRALGSTSCLFILVSPSLFHCTIQESPDPAEGVQSPASGGTQFIAECDLPTAKVPAAFICCAQFPTIG